MPPPLFKLLSLALLCLPSLCCAQETPQPPTKTVTVAEVTLLTEHLTSQLPAGALDAPPLEVVVTSSTTTPPASWLRQPDADSSTPLTTDPAARPQRRTKSDQTHIESDDADILYLVPAPPARPYGIETDLKLDTHSGTLAMLSTRVLSQTSLTKLTPAQLRTYSNLLAIKGTFLKEYGHRTHTTTGGTNDVILFRQDKGSIFAFIWRHQPDEKWLASLHPSSAPDQDARILELIRHLATRTTFIPAPSR